MASAAYVVGHGLRRPDCRLFPSPSSPTCQFICRTPVRTRHMPVSPPCAPLPLVAHSGAPPKRQRTQRGNGRGGRPKSRSSEKAKAFQPLKPDISLGEAERLQKVMSRMGVASRRESEALIAEGKVTVNGKVVKDQGVRVNSRKDVIKVMGNEVVMQPKAVWVAVHKPRGYLSNTLQGQHRTVLSLVPGSRKKNLVPVGSIDEDSSGLVILTNERGHVGVLSHPQNRHVKEWLVDCEGVVQESKVAPLKKGVVLDGEKEPTFPADIKVLGSGTVELGPKEKMKLTRMEVRVRESRHHLVRRLFETAGVKVVRSSRRAFGPVLLGSLKRGTFRYLTPNEIKALKRGVSNANI